MWPRRRFLRTLSGLPLTGLIGERTAAAQTTPIRKLGGDYFNELGVRPFINAAGTYTSMTASLMSPEVMDAIKYASRHYVMLDELHDRVGERIASLLQCEAAMVTAGAASALTLGTAAVLTGSDRKKIVDLPNLVGMKSEVILQKSHRFGYDHAVRNCGVRLVEVETAGELEQAINPNTAMMLFYNNNNAVGQISDQEFVALGKKHGIPTFNDCAADVPPVENLWKYTKMGFDLAWFTFCQTPVPQWTLGICCQSRQQALGVCELTADCGIEFAPRPPGVLGRYSAVKEQPVFDADHRVVPPNPGTVGSGRAPQRLSSASGSQR